MKETGDSLGSGRWRWEIGVMVEGGSNELIGFEKAS